MLNIDKMPLYSMNIDIFFRLFSRAKFIFCVRDPREVILSNFKQLYAPSPAMIMMGKLSGCTMMYDRTMEIVYQTIVKSNIKLHTVKYEELTDLNHQESVISGVFNFLGIRAPREAFEHHKTVSSRKVSNTPSYHAISQPIYRASQHYEHYRLNLVEIEPVVQRWIQYWGYR